MADDAVDAVEQVGELDILGSCGDCLAIGGQDRAERSVPVEQPRGGALVYPAETGKLFQEGSAPSIAVRRQWNAVPAISTISWMNGQVTTMTM